MTLAKTLFIITVSTARFIFPGMPAVPGAPEAAKPPAARSLGIELASDIASGPGAKMTVAVPEGLKAGSTIDLLIDPRTGKPAAKPEPTTAKLFEYWGSGREIGASQPKVTSPGAVPIDADAGRIPDKTYAYWPAADSKPLEDGATPLGAYTLAAGCCGSTSIILAKEQGFLEPVNITSPDSEPDLDKPIVVRWKPVANAAGYLLNAYGGDAKQTITWTSSAKPELARDIDYMPVSKEDLEKFIKQGVLIPSYVASCTIPAGVFKGSASVMLVVTAVGKDIVQTKDRIETWVIVRSTGSVPLHSAPYGPPSPPKNAHRDSDTGE